MSSAKSYGTGFYFLLHPGEDPRDGATPSGACPVAEEFSQANFALDTARVYLLHVVTLQWITHSASDRKTSETSNR